MDRDRLLREARRWRAVAACLGAIAFVAVLGSGTLFPWQASLVAIALLIAMIAMIAIIYTKLQFRYSLHLRPTTELTPSVVLDAVRPRFSDVRASMKPGGSVIEVRPTPSSSEIRIGRIQEGGTTASVISPPPAMGELSAARLRRRALEWADVIDALEGAVGLHQPTR
jgi:hypothetical protein